METHCLDTTADHTVWCPLGDSEVLLLSHLWLGASQSCYMSQLAAVKVEKERSWVQVEEKQGALQPVLCFSLFRKCRLVWCHCWSQVFTSFLCSREWEILVPSDEHLVLEKFVGGCSGSKDGLCPTPFTFNSILLPFLALESGISLYAKGISSCLPLSGSDMGHRTIVLCFPNKPGERKTLTVWMSVFVFALKYGLFMLRFMHLCVWRGGGLGWKWPCMNCCPVFLPCPESTVICPP